MIRAHHRGFAAPGIFLLSFLFMMSAMSQTPAPPAKPAAPPCADAASRQFDFWIGDWDVFDPTGKSVGVNRIEPMYSDCFLHESWKGNGNFIGQSFNRYDASRGVWHQTWVDSSGTLLLLEGGLRDGKMVMSDAATPGKRDPKSVNEISWTPNPDGSVRQHWRATADGGATWKTVFDGKYVRAARPQPAQPSLPDAKK